MNVDPIVAEIHRIRGKLAKECGCVVAMMSARHRRIFQEWKGKKVAGPFHPEWRAPHTAVVAEGKSHYEAKKGQGR